MRQDWCPVLVKLHPTLSSVPQQASPVPGMQGLEQVNPRKSCTTVNISPSSTTLIVVDFLSACSLMRLQARSYSTRGGRSLERRTSHSQAASQYLEPASALEPDLGFVPLTLP